MEEELQEIWTNYDRQTVFNYVETRLHHYLFTKIFKDEAEIMSKIIEIDERELKGFKIDYYLNIPETMDLIQNFSKLETQLEGKNLSENPYSEILSLIKYMFENVKNNDTNKINNKNFNDDVLANINDSILSSKKEISAILKKIVLKI